MHIHVTFWVALLVWSAAITLCEPHPLCVPFFGLALFVNLLVHELGHALAGTGDMKGKVGVCMSWLGSACCSEEEPQCSISRGIIITLMGPLTGLLIALGVCAGVVAAAPSAAQAAHMCGQMLWGEVPAELYGEYPELLLIFGMYLLQVSVLWSALNLLPIFPLDGGVLVHEMMGNTHRAHSISLTVTCLLTLFFITVGVWALAGLMVVLSYYNYRCILVHSE